MMLTLSPGQLRSHHSLAEMQRMLPECVRWRILKSLSSLSLILNKNIMFSFHHNHFKWWNNHQIASKFFTEFNSRVLVGFYQSLLILWILTNYAFNSFSGSFFVQNLLSQRMALLHHHQLLKRETRVCWVLEWNTVFCRYWECVSSVMYVSI